MELQFIQQIKEKYKVFNTIINIIRFHYPKLEAIYVYGSYAKGLQTDSSDVDICILMPQGEINRFDEALNRELTATIRKEVHCVFCTQHNEWCLKEIYNSEQQKVIDRLSIPEPSFFQYIKNLFKWSK